MTQPRTRQELERRIDQVPDDALAYRELGALAIAAGELEEAIDSYELSLYLQPGDVEALLGLSRALRATGRAAEAEPRSRAALARAPASLEARMELAASLKAQGRTAGAIAEYRAALQSHPRDPAVMCNLGYALHVVGEHAAAEENLREALLVQPEFAEARHNLGLVLRERGHLESAISEFSMALEHGRFSASRSALAHALRDAGRIDEALAQYKVVLAPAAPGDAVLNHGQALLMRGDDAQDDYVRGWEAYQQRFAAGGYAARSFGLPAWAGQATGGRNAGNGRSGILVFGEQGLGDEIMFASCIPDLIAREGECVIECNARLAPLFARSFAVPVHGGGKADDTTWLREFPGLRWQIAIGSLPRFYRRRTADFAAHGAPYLRAEPVRAAEWERRLRALGSGRKIGLSWRGGGAQTRGGLRSMPLAALAPLLALEGLQFVSLQHGEVAGEIAQCRRDLDFKLASTPGTGDDLDELAAMICKLDLVVTVDNTVAHLAGALGKPVWILLARGAEWRYGTHPSRMPWYPRARLFRQSTALPDWAPVVSQVVADAAALREGAVP